MSAWTTEQLGTLDRQGEIRVAGRNADGSLRALVIIWQVVVDGELYVRSVRGAEGGWYKGVVQNFEGAIAFDGETHDVAFAPDALHDDEVDAAYFAKYGRGSSSQAITNAKARATTLRVDPR